MVDASARSVLRFRPSALPSARGYGLPLRCGTGRRMLRSAPPVSRNAPAKELARRLRTTALQDASWPSLSLQVYLGRLSSGEFDGFLLAGRSPALSRRAAWSEGKGRWLPGVLSNLPKGSWSRCGERTVIAKHDCGADSADPSAVNYFEVQLDTHLDMLFSSPRMTPSKSRDRICMNECGVLQ